MLCNHPCLPSKDDIGKSFHAAVTADSLTGFTDCQNVAYGEKKTTRCDVEIEDAEHEDGTLEICIEPLLDDQGDLGAPCSSGST